MDFIKPVYAGLTLTPQGNGDLCGGGDSQGLGPFAKFLCSLQGSTENNAIGAFGAFAFLISNIIAVFTIIAGLIFLFQFLIGGINWLTSSGDKAKLEKAQNTLVHATVGLVIVLAAYALVSFVGKVVGIDILINNPGKIVKQLTP